MTLKPQSARTRPSETTAGHTCVLAAMYPVGSSLFAIARNQELDKT